MSIKGFLLSASALSKTVYNQLSKSVYQDVSGLSFLFTQFMSTQVGIVFKLQEKVVKYCRYTRLSDTQHALSQKKY